MADLIRVWLVSRDYVNNPLAPQTYILNTSRHVPLELPATQIKISLSATSACTVSVDCATLGGATNAVSDTILAKLNVGGLWKQIICAPVTELSYTKNNSGVSYSLSGIFIQDYRQYFIALQSAAIQAVLNNGYQNASAILPYQPTPINVYNVRTISSDSGGTRVVCDIADISPGQIADYGVGLLPVESVNISYGLNNRYMELNG